MSDQSGPDGWQQPDNPARPPQWHPKPHAPHSSSVASGNQESSGLERNSQYPSLGGWRLPEGIWYPLLSLLSLGLLTSIPFFHAYRRLRDRGVLVQACIFSAVAILLVVVDIIHRPPEWLQFISALLIFYPFTVGTVQAVSLRRRVYLGAAKPQAAADEAARADIESRGPVERQDHDISGWPAVIIGVPVIFSLVFFLILIPVGGIALTLTGRRNSFVDSTDIIDNIFIFSFASLGAFAFIIWVTVKFKGDKGILRPLAALVAGLIVNIYLGLSIWLIAMKALPPAASPHKLGSMVWWNLFDSIPFANVNSALDWEQPMTEYGARIGWLFLFQRILLLLTLARVIKLLADRWIAYSKQKPSASGDRTRPIAPP